MGSGTHFHSNSGPTNSSKRKGHHINTTTIQSVSMIMMMMGLSASTDGQQLFGRRHKGGQRHAGLHQPYIAQEEAVVLGLRGRLFHHGQCFRHAAVDETLRVAGVMFHHVYGLLEYHPPDPGAVSAGFHVCVQGVYEPLHESVLEMAVFKFSGEVSWNDFAYL